ncbi:hypothetical protein LTR29_003056 [Friedmanniomyces endolithicus]|nr:hypothetical protein LTR29_003056 [Friedmanniomyces endolithicus]
MAIPMPWIPCTERFPTYTGLLQQPMAGLPCARAPVFPFFPNCPMAPNAGYPPVHPLPPDDICINCWTAADQVLQPRERAQLTLPFIRRGRTGTGEPKFVTNILGHRALLCEFCERDEIELYKRQIARNANPPPTNHHGWEETCTCQEARIRAPPGGTYCIGCDEVNAEMLERFRIARNPQGVLVTATHALMARRAAIGKDFACRCGRDTVAPTAHPKVLQCLCCGGVTIDRDQVKLQRDTQANLTARAAWPVGHRHALRPLRMAGHVRGPRNLALPAVTVNNNRKPR